MTVSQRRLPLSRGFYDRPTLEVAAELLSCCLCRNINGTVHRWQITETEAYDGPEDKACHAHKGRTRRTEVMFGPAGNWYVYLCYGVHWMLNVVTGPVDFPAAVLIRGAGDLHGPGRLTKALQITGELNGQSALEAGELWIERGVTVTADPITTTPRIGVAYAGPDWSQRPYRFIPGARLDLARK
ncbi:MAG: DNA-3-methyladenine glycosylase [Puniceicoccaceae bacterium]